MAAVYVVYTCHIWTIVYEIDEAFKEIRTYNGVPLQQIVIEDVF